MVAIIHIASTDWIFCMDATTPQKHPSIRALLNDLDARREPFLDDLEASVKDYINQKPTSECLHLVTLNEDGSVHTDLPARINSDFLYVLFLFCFKKTHNGRTIDSALTKPVVEIFRDRYAAYIQGGDGALEKAMVDIVVDTDAFHEAIRRGINRNPTVKLIDKEARKALADIVLAQVIAGTKGVSSEVAGHTLAISAQIKTLMGGTAISAAVANAAGTTVTYVLSSKVAQLAAAKIMVMVAHKVNALVLKALALPLVKAAVISAAKKVVVAAIFAAFLKVVATKFVAIGPAGLAGFVVAPAIILYFRWQWNKFPKKLAKSVSSELRKDAGAAVPETNEVVIATVVDYVLGKGIDAFEEEIAGADLKDAAKITRKLSTG